MDTLPKTESAVQYIVDSSGSGTHKTITDAVTDAEKHPNRVTTLRIIPHITIENFSQEEEPHG